MPELQRLLTQARRISEHRTKEAEAEIRRVYQNLLKDLRAFVAGEYERFAVDDRLDFSILQQKGEFARFLEETQKIVNAHEPEVKREVRDIIEQTYARCWGDFQEAVGKSADSAALREALRGVRGVTPEVVKRAVINPVSGLTLNDRLEKHRQEVIYNIKQQLGTGLTQGDRYSTMARRVAGEVEGNYKKAVRIVRTETHRVREAGFHDSALEVDGAARAAGLQMVKTWRTMKDEWVRPNARYRTKSGWKTVRRGPADHQKMEGVSIPVDQEFDLGGGVKAKAPGQSGVAGQDINCRCFLEYELQRLKTEEDSGTIILKRAIGRKEKNTGVFQNLQIPMQKREVLAIARKYAVNMTGITIKIQRSESLLALPITGDADTADIGRIDLFPNAFADEETLVRTLLHEKTHVAQLKKYGKQTVQNRLAYMERQAYRLESIAYHVLKKKVKG